MRRHAIRLFALSGCLLASLAWGQVPARLGYQGRLLQADGTPATGVVQIVFSLFAAQTGGAALWTETQSIPMSNGYYSVVLGSMGAIPSSVFDGTERYLELSIGGTPLTPRQPVDSVAYAMVAGNVNGGTVNASSLSIGGTVVWTDAGILAGPATAALQSRVTQTCTGSTFVQQINANGTVTCGVAIGPDGGGLTAVAHDGTLNGDGAVVPLGVNTGVIQNRVSGTCGAGQYMQTVAANGTVTCGTDQTGLASVSHDGTLSGNGTAGTPLSITAGQFVTAVTANAPLSATVGTTPALSISQANGSTNGFLASADWTTFNGKAPGSGSANYVQVGPAAAQTGGFALTGNGILGGQLTVGSTTAGTHAVEVTGVVAATGFKLPGFLSASTNAAPQSFTCASGIAPIGGVSALTVNPAVPSILDITASASLTNNTAGSTSVIELFVDGAAVHDATPTPVTLAAGCSGAGEAQCQADLTTAVMVAAGAHTVDLKFLCSGAGASQSVNWATVVIRVWAQ